MVISILPPWCMRKVRSNDDSTFTPSRPAAAATIASACSWSEALTTSSRITDPVARPHQVDRADVAADRADGGRELAEQVGLA